MACATNTYIRTIAIDTTVYRIPYTYVLFMFSCCFSLFGRSMSARVGSDRRGAVRGGSGRLTILMFTLFTFVWFFMHVGVDIDESRSRSVQTVIWHSNNQNKAQPNRSTIASREFSYILKTSCSIVGVQSQQLVIISATIRPNPEHEHEHVSTGSNCLTNNKLSTSIKHPFIHYRSRETDPEFQLITEHEYEHVWSGSQTGTRRYSDI
jgi:hypothetical protein